MKKLIRGIFGLFGLEVSRKRIPKAPVPAPPKPLSPDSMLAGMKRARNQWDVKPGTVIDLGAAAGTWTMKALQVWNDASYLLFEPLEERRVELEELSRQHRNLTPVFAAAGEREGKVQFAVADDLDGSAIADESKHGNTREVVLTTLDIVLREKSSAGPFVIKFDTHGFEVPILKGAQETLKNTSLVIMECYGFKLTKESLLFHEMCAYMQSLGFRVADIVDPLRRPGDAAYWQCDIFFLRDDHPMFRRNTYAQ